jgi:Tat protein translocase TatB subunit
LYLFILESIGTSELLMIAAVALIVFGPRKLPYMARKAAKTMAEFRKVSNEFRSTWEKEAFLEEDERNFLRNPLAAENSIARESPAAQTVAPTAAAGVTLPEIKKAPADFIKAHTPEPPAPAATGKQDWL